MHLGGQYRTSPRLRPHRASVLQLDVASALGIVEETATKGQETTYPLHQQPEVGLVLSIIYKYRLTTVLPTYLLYTIFIYILFTVPK